MLDGLCGVAWRASIDAGMMEFILERTMVLTMLALLVPDASACGGFFCNNLTPIKQSREVLLFEVDPTQNKTTMHAQVDYDGPPGLFAWVVPVRGVPDLFLSTDQAFVELDRLTKPRFELVRDELGECLQPAPPANADEDSDGWNNWEDQVEVLASERVGPYDTMVLEADSAQALVQFLQSNQYAVPMQLEEVIAPYLAEGHNFLAMRLSGDEDTGSLAPLGMRYEGTTPTIPLHLTQVAADDDMPVIAYTLGPSRAVPSNYLHMQINMAAVHWFDEGSNYPDLVARGADQAGGHAFATDFSGPTDLFDGRFLPASLQDVDLAGASGPVEFLSRLQALSFDGPVVRVLEQVLPRPEGVDSVVYRSGYDPAWAPGFDAVTAAAHVHERLLEPLAEVQAAFDRSNTLTRLTTRISPSEMNLDPRFHFDSRIPQDIGRVRTAVLEQRCEGLAIGQATRVLVLPDGTSIDLPPEEDLARHSMTDQQWLDQLQEPAAIRIESFTPSGADLIFDGTMQVANQVEELNEKAEDLAKSGGCDSSGGGAALWLGLLLPLLFRRQFRKNGASCS